MTAVDSDLWAGWDDVDVTLDRQPRSSERESLRGMLPHQSLADLCREVDESGPRRWLLRGLWPTGDYGVHSAEPKAQKTWTTIDLAVSVASGTPWLGLVDVDDPGPVIMYAGEGSPHNLVRRLRAVCASRGLRAEDLPIIVCTRAPHLGAEAHLRQMAQQMDRVRPKLATLDPFYLAAQGAQASSLYDMGALLEGPQHICQGVGSALWVATHNNRKGDARGSSRISGAGPAEWGRVLLVGDVRRRQSDPETRETTVTVAIDAIGGEIADQGVTVTRRIRAVDPDDLDSPLLYAVEATYGTEDKTSGGGGGGRRARGESPGRARIVDALSAGPLTTSQIQAAVGLARGTCSRRLGDLVRDGAVRRRDPAGPGQEAIWSLIDGDA